MRMSALGTVFCRLGNMSYLLLQALNLRSTLYLLIKEISHVREMRKASYHQAQTRRLELRGQCWSMACACVQCHFGVLAVDGW